jgi:hypothetical protein
MCLAFWPATVLLSCSMLTCGIPALAQIRSNQNQHFYDGASRGVHGGNYGQGNYHGHDRDRYQNNQGGIGPGKGALIGGAAGACWAQPLAAV